MKRVHLDLETFCMLDLKKVGLWRYVTHPTFEILLAAWSVGDGPIRCEEGISEDLEAALMEADEVHAFNAQFERLALSFGAGINLPASKMRCTMVHAWSCGFFGKLSEVSKQMGRPLDKQKLATGTRLIALFCTPRKPTKRNPNLRLLPDENPVKWEEFKQYNIQDVVAERDLYHWLQRYPMPPSEQELYALDQDINDTGLPINMQLVEGACHIYAAEKARLFQQLKEVTGLDNPNSVQQLIPWFAEQGLSMPNMQKDTVAQALTIQGLPERPREALEIRQKLARTSAEKWVALRRSVAREDSRARFMFAMNGASRTLRWAGRIVQIHNLPWTRVKAPGLSTLVASGARDIVAMLYPDVLEVLTSTIRNAITAPDGHLLVVVDLSNIESRVIGYVSGCARLNAVFTEGRDPYRDYASVLFSIPEHEVTKEQRNWCKPPALGCGYQLGWRGLIEYAEGMGVEMEEEQSARAVTVFRSTYHEIPTMWQWLANACIAVTRDRGLRLNGYAVSIYRDENFLFIELPGGHRLTYFQPEVHVNMWDREAFTYMGKNQTTGLWSRVFTHGGKITENIVQAIARDILVHGMKLCAANGVRLIGHVHDELIALVKAALAKETMERMIRLMSVTPGSLPGLRLAAEGFIAKEYRK